MRAEELLKEIANCARESGMEVYAVGGYVRDTLLKKPVTDIDFVVVGDGIHFAKYVKKALNVHDFVIFPRFRTAKINYKGFQLEFVGARRESYDPESRNPIVEASDLTADLMRRDFTINAMAMSLNSETYGEIIDPLNGRADLERRILRTPLSPKETFFDDPLRIMRAVRFSTQLDFEIEPNVLAALEGMTERLKIISQERITSEIFKMLAAPKPSIGFELMSKTGILPIILPEIEIMKGVEQRGTYHHKDVFFHTLKVIDNIAATTDKIELRFTAMIHDIGKPRTKAFKDGVGWTFHGHDEIGARMLNRFCREMKLPNDLMRYAQKLVRLHLRPIALAEEEVTDSAVRRLMAQAGEDVDDLMTLCRADITSGNPHRVKRHLANFDYLTERMQAVADKDEMRAFQSPVRGDEIMQICDIQPGPLVGKLKTMIEEAILDGVIPFDHDAALAYLEEHKLEFVSSVQ